MLTPGTTWQNPRTGARLTVIEDAAEQTIVERLMRPHTGHTDAHFHRDFDQAWRVLSGVLTCTIDGEERRMQPGERADVPRGMPHRDPWNDSGEDLVFRLLLEPNSRFIEVFTRTLGDLMERDKLNDQGEFTQLQLFGVLRATQADSWKTGLPVALQRPVVAVGAALGRARGHRPVAP